MMGYRCHGTSWGDLAEDWESQVLDEERGNKIFRSRIRMPRSRSNIQIGFHLFTDCFIILLSSENLENVLGTY